MKVRAYAYAGIGFIAGICGVLALIFYKMGFVGIAPFALAVLIVACAVFGFVKSLPEKKKPAKEKKSKKKKAAGEDAPAAQA